MIVVALGFQPKRSWGLSGLHPSALDRASALRPSISLSGSNGIPIRDALESPKYLAQGRIRRTARESGVTPVLNPTAPEFEPCEVRLANGSFGEADPVVRADVEIHRLR